MKKTRFLAFAAAVMMLATAATSCNSKGDYAVKLGILAPTTGPVSSYGQAALNGALLAIKQANEAKMFDKEIGYKHYDEKGDAAEAVSAYEKLVNVDKVDAIIGDVTSTPSIDVAKAAVKKGIPMITPTGTAAPITIDKGNVFRACFLDAMQGKAMATYAAKNFKKVAILYNSSDEYSIGLKEAFETEAKAKGLEIVVTEAYASGDSDFKAQLTKINTTKPDAIYLPDYYNTVSTICSQKKDFADLAAIPAMGGDGWDGVLGIENLDASTVENAVFSNHFALEDTDEKVASFVAAYRAEYKVDPASFAALGYDATNIMLQAVKKAGSTEYAKVVEALKGLEFDGVTGKITFDANGDPVKPISIVEIKGGKYTLKELIEQ